MAHANHPMNSDHQSNQNRLTRGADDFVVRLIRCLNWDLEARIAELSGEGRALPRREENSR